MTLRLIQVGLGEHGMGVASNHCLKSCDFTLTGLVDVNPERLKLATELLGARPDVCYTDYETAFAQGTADAVLISAASPFHYDICKSALAHNLHVLIEKPFVTDIRQAQELINLAQRQQRLIMVSQNYRWYRNVLTMKKAIDSKSLGETMYVDAKFFYFHDGKPYQRQMQHYMLLEMAIHHIDMMRFLFGRNVHSVQGQTWNSPDSGYRGDPHVQAAYQMDGGLPIFYLGSLLSKGLTSPWEGIWRVQCEGGSIHLDHLGPGYGVYLINDRQEKTRADDVSPQLEGIDGVLSAFAHAIINEQQPPSSAEDNLHTLAAVFATSASAREGRPVQPLSLLT